jgi:hypothetical protein
MPAYFDVCCSRFQMKQIHKNRSIYFSVSSSIGNIEVYDDIINSPTNVTDRKKSLAGNQ